MAILVGTAVRTAWRPTARWTGGIAFSAKTLLEVAVLLLGASISASMIIAAVTGSLAVLMIISFTLIKALGIA